MSVYLTGRFWAATLERACKTTAQAAVATIAGTVAGIIDIDWVQLASVSGLAGLVSVLTSVASAKIGGDGPSLGAEELRPK